MTTYHDRYNEKVDVIANRLRELADDVQREGKPRESKANSLYPEYTRHVRANQALIHLITWGIADLNMAYLLETAVDADSIERHEDNE